LAKRIAIEFDAQHLRLAVGTFVANGPVRLDRFDSIEIPAESDEASTEHDRITLGLKAFVSENHLGKSSAVINANRSMIEMRVLHLPPAGTEDLPDMVRFAAQRSFSQLGDNWPIDFVTLSSDSDAVYVLAATINPLHIARMRAMCDVAGLTFEKIAIRSMNSALFALDRSDISGNHDVLVVSPSGDEYDLSVVSSGVVKLSRTVLLPAGSRTRLAGEVRRTIVSSSSQTPPAQPDTILCLSSIDAGLLEDVAKAGEFTLKTLGQDQIATSKSVTSEDLAGQAGLISLLGTPTGDDPRCIDFLNPRKRPEPNRPILKMALVGGLVGAALLGGIGWYYSTMNAYDQEIAQLKKSLESEKETIKIAQESIDKWSRVVDFEASNYQLLDELKFLSANSPPPEKMAFGSLNFNISPTTKVGEITTTAAFVDSETRDDFNGKLSDERHRTVTQTLQMASDKGTAYKFISDPRITISTWNSAIARQLATESSPSPSDAGEPLAASGDPSEEDPSEENPSGEDSAELDRSPETPNVSTEGASPETPKSSEAVAGEPATAEPATGEPTTGEPTTGEPTTPETIEDAPVAGTPGTTEPATSESSAEEAKS
jgi:hypothetical protein